MEYQEFYKGALLLTETNSSWAPWVFYGVGLVFALFLAFEYITWARNDRTPGNRTPWTKVLKDFFSPDLELFNYVGSRIQLRSYYLNKQLAGVLPLSGTVISSYFKSANTFSGGETFYIVELDEPHPFTQYDTDTVIFLPNISRRQIDGDSLMVYLYFIPPEEVADRSKARIKNMGWVILDIIE